MLRISSANLVLKYLPRQPPLRRKPKAARRMMNPMNPMNKNPRKMKKGRKKNAAPVNAPIAIALSIFIVFVYKKEDAAAVILLYKLPEN